MSFLDTNIDVAKRMYDVNIWGVLRVTQAFAPLVIATKGIIVMAGSTAELANLPFQSAYCASKAALLLLSETLRVEVQPFGVKVMYVTTGFVESNWYFILPFFLFLESRVGLMRPSGLVMFPNSNFRKTRSISQSPRRSNSEQKANRM